MKNILITLVTLIGFILPQECEEPIDVWFKISSDKQAYGNLLTIDMSAGYALYDEFYIYLFVFERDTREELVVMFPIGYWETEKIEKIIPKKNNKEKKEFDLDEYLKQNKGKGIKIAKQVGE